MFANAGAELTWTRRRHRHDLRHRLALVSGSGRGQGGAHRRGRVQPVEADRVHQRYDSIESVQHRPHCGRRPDERDDRCRHERPPTWRSRPMAARSTSSCPPAKTTRSSGSATSRRTISWRPRPRVASSSPARATTPIPITSTPSGSRRYDHLGRPRRLLHGAGIFQITRRRPSHHRAARHPGLFPVGHLVIDAQGRAAVTAVAQDGPSRTATPIWPSCRFPHRPVRP